MKGCLLISCPFFLFTDNEPCGTLFPICSFGSTTPETSHDFGDFSPLYILPIIIGVGCVLVSLLAVCIGRKCRIIKRFCDHRTITHHWSAPDPRQQESSTVAGIQSGDNAPLPPPYSAIYGVNNEPPPSYEVIMVNNSFEYQSTSLASSNTADAETLCSHF